MKILSLFGAVMMSLAALGSAQAGDITVSNAWARASIGMGKTGAAFMTLKNTGKVDDRLVSASSDVAKKVSVHTSLMENGIMKMRPVKAIEVPAGGMVMLKPGGLHIMFMGLKAPFKQGESFTLKLQFEKAGSIDTVVSIKAGGAMMMDHGKMDMKNPKMKKMNTN